MSTYCRGTSENCGLPQSGRASPTSAVLVRGCLSCACSAGGFYIKQGSPPLRPRSRSGWRWISSGSQRSAAASSADRGWAWNCAGAWGWWSFWSGLASGREEIPWPQMALVLVLGRLCEPTSELDLAEHFYEASALA